MLIGLKADDKVSFAWWRKYSARLLKYSKTNVHILLASEEMLTLVCLALHAGCVGNVTDRGVGEVVPAVRVGLALHAHVGGLVAHRFVGKL